MKLLFSFFMLCFFVSSAIAQDVNKISPLLMAEMQKRNGNTLPTLLLLDDQVDIDKLRDSFEVHNIPVNDRAIIINKKLRGRAGEKQTPVISALNNLGIEDIESLWIINAIAIQATADEIYAASEIESIRYMDLDLPAVLDEPTQRSTASGAGSRVSGNVEQGIVAINAPAMWARGYTGYGTKALIIDTGVDPTHPTLARNFLGNTRPVSASWFQGNNFQSPDDCDNHGTHVAGTILGIDRETSDTIGVAYNAMWMGAAGLCGGVNFALMRSFEWALDPDQNPETTDDMPDVINNSWRSGQGGDECSGAFAQIFDVLEAAGVAVVFSAGNDGPDVSTITAPKNVNKNLVNTFTVAAVNGRNLNVADFSSRGPSICGGEGSLLIKPEVAAPGVSVRSGIRGGGYASFSGTSMAAPHVAGAILLLKEAFPYLSGDELKLALYFTTIDLGDPGEDDVYGMGLIDVDAAYEYLIENGNEPVSPFKNVDLAIEQFDYEVDYCSGEITVFLDLKNNGIETITSINIGVLDNKNEQAQIFSTIVNEEIRANEQRDVQFTVEFAGQNGIDISIMADVLGRIDERSINNIVAINLDVAQTEDWTLDLNEEAFSKFICSDTRILLTNESGEGTYLWYDEEFNDNPFHIGNDYLLSAPSNDTVVNIYLGLEVTETLLNPSFENPSFLFLPEEESGIRFQTLQDVRLDHFTLNNTARTFHSIKITDDRENFIWGANRFYNAGEVVVPVGEIIPKGSTINLTTIANRDLIVSELPNQSSEQMEGYVRILGSFLNGVFTNELLPGMYGLSFSAEVPCARKPLRVHVRETENSPVSLFEVSPETDFTSGQMIPLTNLSVNAEEFEWDLGNGMTTNEASPNPVYEEPGTYEITLKAQSGDCFDVYRSSITINEASVSTLEITPANPIQVFPNPTRGDFSINVRSLSQSITRLTLISSTGLQYDLEPGELINGQYTFHLSSNNVPSGIYFVKTVMTNDQVFINKLIIY